MSGQQARSILESIGRGARLPSEIASRLGVKQTALSKPFTVLRNTTLIKRELPFSENIRSSKRVLYYISDIALACWYGVFSPHRSRWHLYSDKQKARYVHEHASWVLEDVFRDLYPDAKRFWDGKGIEFDGVRYDP